MILFSEALQKFHDTELAVTSVEQLNTAFFESIAGLPVEDRPLSLDVLQDNADYFHFELGLVESADWIRADVDAQQLADIIDILKQGLYVRYNLTHIAVPRPSKFHVWQGDDDGWQFGFPADLVASHLKPLTRRQFKLALLQNNLLDDIDAAIAAIADPLQKAIIQIEYQESTTFERNSPSVVAMLGILGLSDVQANEMWLQGLAI